MNKCCTQCGVEYPRTREYFASDKRHKDGLQSRCRKCDNVATAAWVKKNPEKHCEYYKKHYQENKERLCKYQKEYRKTLRGHVTHLMKHIKDRCTNPKDISYKNYGGHGIECEFTTDKLCDWLTANSINPHGLQIHRINNNGNYTLNNIEFLAQSEHIKLHWLQGDYDEY